MESFPFEDILQLETQEELFSAIIDLEDFEILREYIEVFEERIISKYDIT